MTMKYGIIMLTLKLKIFSQKIVFFFQDRQKEKA